MNRYGIIVDRSKTEREQIAQLRAEHLRQYPQIVMKNPDFTHLRDFVTSHPLNRTDVMRNAPDKIKVMNIMQDMPGFEYVRQCLVAYEIDYNSTSLEPTKFIRWLVSRFPKNFGQSLHSCKNADAILKHLRGQTSWIDDFLWNADESCCRLDIRSAGEISEKTRIHCLLNGLAEFPKCRTCGKTIVANVLSVTDGFRPHCDESCGTLDQDVKKKTSEACMKKFGSETYLGSKTGTETKRRRLEEKYGDGQFSRTGKWKKKMESTSMSRYGTRWPSQSEEVRRRMSESMKKSSARNVAKCLATKKARRGGRFWTNEELKRISEKNRSPENQAKRLERARRRRERYYDERLARNEFVAPLFPRDEFVEIPFRKLPAVDLTWECRKCGAVFDAPLAVFYADGRRRAESKAYARCPACYPNRRRSSLEEVRLKEFIESELPNGMEVVHGQYENFKTIPPFQLDVIIKEKGTDRIAFAVEFDGVKWHGLENGSGMDRQLRKTVMCERLGMPLVHVFEDEWLYDREKTEELLRTYLSGKFRSMAFSGDVVTLDRSKFCKAVSVPGYELAGETPPCAVRRKGLEKFGKGSHAIPDCDGPVYAERQTCQAERI